MGFSRRVILKSLGFGSAAWLLAPSRVPLVRANPKAPERFFIFCYFGGGWDTLLSLDPRDPGVFTESRIRETKIEPGYSRLPMDQFKPEIIQPEGSKIDFGPVMGGFSRHFNKSCVVRGVAMDTVSHEVGRRYFITGQMPRGQTAVGSSISTWLVAEQGERSAIPNLVVGVESYNSKSPAFASGLRVSGVNDLLSTLRDGPESPKDKLRDLIEEYRAQNNYCDPAALNEAGLMALIGTAQKSARVLISQNLAQHFDFMNNNNPDMRDIRQRYGINNLGSGEAQAAMAFQALKRGIAQSVTINLTGGLDTHGNEWATTQSGRQYNAFKALGVLVDDLAATPHPSIEGQTLLDATTIMCFSEFARTPLLNGNNGRDHWLASSALLVGAGVPHNKVVGATTDKGFNPSAIDPNTGIALKEGETGGQLITPTRIAASLLESAGYSSEQFRIEGFPCLKA